MKPTVLIVDRHSYSRQKLAYRLTRSGFHVMEAGGTEEVYQALSTREIDVVLLDLISLKEQALWLLTSIKHVYREAEVILLTSPERIGLAIKGMKLGAFDDLLTPVDVDLLVKRVCAALEHKINRKNQSGLTAAIRAFTTRVGLQGVKVWYGESIYTSFWPGNGLEVIPG